MLFVVAVAAAAVVVAVDVVAVGIHAVVIRCVLHVVRFDVVGVDVIVVSELSLLCSCIPRRQPRRLVEPRPRSLLPRIKTPA